MSAAAQWRAEVYFMDKARPKRRDLQRCQMAGVGVMSHRYRKRNRRWLSFVLNDRQWNTGSMCMCMCMCMCMWVSTAIEKARLLHGGCCICETATQVSHAAMHDAAKIKAAVVSTCERVRGQVWCEL